MYANHHKKWSNDTRDQRPTEPANNTQTRRPFNPRFKPFSAMASKQNWNSNPRFDPKRTKTYHKTKPDSDAPQEISSKKKVKPVFEITSIQTRRDPRFDEKCGRFSQNVFDQNYSFVKEMREKEMIQLKRMLKKTKNEEKRQELSYLLERMKNQQKSEQIKEKKKEIETNVRKDLSEDIGTKTKTFVNKSTLKRVELMDRFMHLKKSGKLKQYLEKKRKKNAMRDRKKIGIS